LLQLLLSLMVRTDYAVFWIGTVSHEAWRYVEKAASASTTSVGAQRLTPLGRKEVEGIVLSRHQRSGMTLQFMAPRDPSPLLKRRLRRARGQERQQEILQGIYFDALFRQSGDDIALGLLYWLRSVDFRDEGDMVVVRPFQAMNFNQLKRLDLPGLFALKAFVIHNTLTAAELAGILRIPVERGALILEALLNLALIERVGRDGVPSDQPPDTALDRFRLSRLVIYPVVQRLRDARVLY
jgi:hypothetical protein